jgi:hypothetical protein
MFQGDTDVEVPRNQAALFSSEIKQAGMDITAEFYPWRGHMLNDILTSDNREVYAFLDQALQIPSQDVNAQ